MSEDIHVKPCEIVVPLGEMTWVDRVSELYGNPINDVTMRHIDHLKHRITFEICNTRLITDDHILALATLKKIRDRCADVINSSLNKKNEKETDP